MAIAAPTPTANCYYDRTQNTYLLTHYYSNFNVRRFFRISLPVRLCIFLVVVCSFLFPCFRLYVPNLLNAFVNVPIFRSVNGLLGSLAVVNTISSFLLFSATLSYENTCNFVGLCTLLFLFTYLFIDSHHFYFFVRASLKSKSKMTRQSIWAKAPIKLIKVQVTDRCRFHSDEIEKKRVFWHNSILTQTH